MNNHRERKALFVCSRYSTLGGEDVQTDRAAAALGEAGWSVTRLSAEPPRSVFRAAARIAESGGTRWSWHWSRRVRRSVAYARPTVAFVQNTFPWITGSVIDALVALRVPTIVELHNFRIVCPAGTLVREGRECTECSSSGLQSAWGNRCYRNSTVGSWMAARSSLGLRSALERSSRNIVMATPSLFAACTFAELAPGIGRVEVLPNIIPRDSCTPAHEPAQGQLLLVSRLSEEKGLPEVLGGFDTFAQDREYNLLVAGDGPLRESLQAEASGLGANIRFLGQVDESRVHELMRTAVGVLCPSRAPETFGMTAAEAACAGAPLLVSDSGALVETAGGERAAIVVRGCSEAAWTAALEQLAGDPESALGRAKVAFDHARTHFGHDIFVSRFEELAVLAEHRASV